MASAVSSGRVEIPGCGRLFAFHRLRRLACPDV